MYVSPGRDDVCGLFIIGRTNQVVAIEFTGFNIDCDHDGLLVVGVQFVVFGTRNFTPSLPVDNVWTVTTVCKILILSKLILHAL